MFFFPVPYDIFHCFFFSCGLYAVKFFHNINHSCLIIFTRDVTNPHFFFSLGLQVLVLVSFLHHFQFVLCSLNLFPPFIDLSVVVYL